MYVYCIYVYIPLPWKSKGLYKVKRLPQERDFDLTTLGSSRPRSDHARPQVKLGVKHVYLRLAEAFSFSIFHLEFSRRSFDILSSHLR